MTSEQFDKIVEEFRSYQSEILYLKKGEYAQGEDRLINFRSVGVVENRRMSQVATTLLLNHMQRICSQVNAGGFSWTMWDGDKEGLKQKLVDAMNYLYLLAACLESEAEERTTEGGAADERGTVAEHMLKTANDRSRAPAYGD